MLLVISTAFFLQCRDLPKLGFARRKGGAKTVHALFVHAQVVVGKAQRLCVPQRLGVLPCLIPAVIMVDGEVHDLAAGCKIAVIHNEGDSRLAAQRFIVSLAEAHQNQPVHIPHRGKNRDLADVSGGFYHQKIALLVDLARECVQGRHHKAVLQDPSLVLDMVVHDHADDTGVVSRQQDTGHIGNIAGLFQLLLDPFYRCIGNFVSFSVDHIGDCCCAKTQSVCNVCDPNPVLFHAIPSFLFALIPWYNTKDTFSRVKRITYNENRS